MGCFLGFFDIPFRGYYTLNFSEKSENPVHYPDKSVKPRKTFRKPIIFSLFISQNLCDIFHSSQSFPKCLFCLTLLDFSAYLSDRSVESDIFSDKKNQLFSKNILSGKFSTETFLLSFFSYFERFLSK